MFLQTKNLTSVFTLSHKETDCVYSGLCCKSKLFFLLADDSIVVVHLSDTEHTSVKEKLYQKYATRALMSGNLS